MGFSIKKSRFLTYSFPEYPNGLLYQNIGFQPNLLLFWGAGQFGTFTGLPWQFGTVFGTAIGAGTNQQRDASGVSQRREGDATTYSYSHQMQNQIARSPDSAAGVAFAHSVQNIDSTGFTLYGGHAISGDYDCTDVPIHYLAAGGTDLTGSAGGRFQVNTTTGNQSVSGVGFQPDVIVFFVGNRAFGDFDLKEGNNTFALGIAQSSSARWTTSVAHEHFKRKKDQPKGRRIQRTNRCLYHLSPSLDTAYFGFDFVSMNANGFTINVTEPAEAITNRYCYYLALKGLQFKVGSFTKTTAGAPATQDITIGFQPRTVFFCTWGLPASTTIEDHVQMSLGGADDQGNEGVGWVRVNKNTVPADGYGQDSTSYAIAIWDRVGQSTVLKAAANVSYLPNGFRLNWTTNDSTATEINYVAFTGTSPGFTETPQTTLALAPVRRK